MGTHYTGTISVTAPTALQNEMVALISQTRKLESKIISSCSAVFILWPASISGSFSNVSNQDDQNHSSLSFPAALELLPGLRDNTQESSHLKHCPRFTAQHCSPGSIVLGLAAFRTGRLKGLSFICLKFQLPPLLPPGTQQLFLKCRGPFQEILLLFSSGWQILLIFSLPEREKTPSDMPPIPKSPSATAIS